MEANDRSHVAAFRLGRVVGFSNQYRYCDSLERLKTCEERAVCNLTLPPMPRGLGEVERRSGGGSPSSESVQRKPYSVCAECSHCAGRRLKTKESRAVSPRMGFPPWWISALKRGRLGKGVSRGGKPRRGIQQYRHRPTRSYNTDGVIPVISLE